ncbi:hypothetical protein F5876DRAFT_67939 [Lentinula aff. lateritia]|uniref:Uncharacterized protein n=1 Tax=Lentinula aff. lateritia TaxID=2804960 RepID=A0ACC1TSP6_9AGAR|nr:hypothetical protein F5876DRAFT_67939 [Lentinula aff. lateritia]
MQSGGCRFAAALVVLDETVMNSGHYGLSVTALLILITQISAGYTTPTKTPRILRLSTALHSNEKFDLQPPDCAELEQVIVTSLDAPPVAALRWAVGEYKRRTTSDLFFIFYLVSVRWINGYTWRGDGGVQGMGRQCYNVAS